MLDRTTYTQFLTHFLLGKRAQEKLRVAIIQPHNNVIISNLDCMKNLCSRIIIYLHIIKCISLVATFQQDENAKRVKRVSLNDTTVSYIVWRKLIQNIGDVRQKNREN